MNPTGFATPRLGVCYYPEHWPEAMWADDAARMFAMGIRMVRIGEFAWSRLEPVPGDYQFEWLERAIDTLAAAGLETFARLMKTASREALAPDAITVSPTHPIAKNAKPSLKNLLPTLVNTQRSSVGKPITNTAATTPSQVFQMQP